MTISEAIAQRIKYLLFTKNMSQYSLEQKAGLSHDTLKSIMKGKAKGVNLKTVISIADGFEMNVWDFLNDPMFTYENLNMD